MPADSPFAIIILAAGVIAGLGCLVGAFHYYRRKHLIDGLPTSKVQGVFIGLTELSGTAETEEPIESYLSGAKCVYYSYNVEEHWHRFVTESYTDAQGHHKTRTRSESGWKTVDSGVQAPPFYIKDDTGIIRILPEGADIHAGKIFDTTCSRGDALYYLKGPAVSIPNSTHRRRFTEEAIPLHAKLYVVGQARERDDVVAAEIAKCRNAPMFLISTRDEVAHSRQYARRFWFWAVFGFAVTLGGAAIYSAVGSVPASIAAILLPAAGLYLGGLFIGWVWNAFNSLVRLRQRVKQAQSQIEVEAKRRYDLIPRIFQIVDAYRRYESGLHQAAAQLRARAEALGEEAGEDLKGLVPLLTAVVEDYPSLKADEQFYRLQQLLSETEQRLALARDYYNQVSTFYNTRLRVIPDRFLAAATGFKPFALLSSSDLERARVEVKLAD